MANPGMVASMVPRNGVDVIVLSRLSEGCGGYEGRGSAKLAASYELHSLGVFCATMFRSIFVDLAVTVP